MEKNELEAPKAAKAAKDAEKGERGLKTPKKGKRGGTEGRTGTIRADALLDFPETRQSTNFSCGAASVQGVLHYYGIEVREDKIIEGMGVRPTGEVHSGVDPLDLAEWVRGKGLRVEVREGMKLSELRGWLDKGVPVIMAIQAWAGGRGSRKEDYGKGYDDGHYVVAIGYSDADGVVIFDDPSLLGNHGFLSYGKLVRRWHDKDSKGKVWRRLGMAVWGKPAKYRGGELKPIL